MLGNPCGRASTPAPCFPRRRISVFRQWSDSGPRPFGSEDLSGGNIELGNQVLDLHEDARSLVRFRRGDLGIECVALPKQFFVGWHEFELLSVKNR